MAANGAATGAGSRRMNDPSPLPATGEREPGGPPMRVSTRNRRPARVSGRATSSASMAATTRSTPRCSIPMAPAGQRLVCRCTASNARLIAYALNRAIGG